MTLKEKITYYSDFFETKEKQDKSIITILKDNAPSELYDAVQKAHGDKMPNNYIYSWFSSMLGDLDGYDIETQEDIDEAMDEIIDGTIDCYTSNLTEWLNNNNSNVYYLTEVLESWGTEIDGFQLLSQAQRIEISEVFDCIQGLLNKE